MQSRNELDPSEVGKFLAEGYLARNTADIQHLSLATYRLLALGQPVSTGALAKILDMQEGEVSALLDTFPPSVLERDDEGSIVAFIGLSLSPTAHRFVLEGRTLYTWCVLDALFLPELLGERARVATNCPGSGSAIALEVAPDRIVASSPPGVVMSTVAPDAQSCRDNLRGAFCSQVNLFTSADSFTAWAKAHPGVAYVPLAEAFDLARARNRGRFPDIDLRARVN
jgi:alkylmercury lyase